MKDFLDEDVTKLLDVENDTRTATDKALAAILESDRRMINQWREDKRLSWPEPVRRRHVR